MRRAANIDVNQPHIAAVLRACGLSVLHLHQVGRGCSDLLVAGYNQKTDCHEQVLVELKSSADSKLKPSESAFIEAWPCEVLVAWNEWPVLDWFGITEGGPK